MVRCFHCLIFHFQYKSVNISTIVTSKLKCVCTCIDWFLSYCFKYIYCMESSVSKQIHLKCVLFLHCTPLGPILFIFMQFSVKFGQIIGCRPFRKILDPPLMIMLKYAIDHASCLSFLYKGISLTSNEHFLTLNVPCVTIVFYLVSAELIHYNSFPDLVLCPITAHNIKLYTNFTLSDLSQLQLLCFVKL